MHKFGGIPKGAHYTITVSPNTEKGQAATVEVTAEPLPVPTQLQVWPEKNGSFVVYWKPIEDFHYEKFHYEIVVYPGTELNQTGVEVAILQTTKPPILIHPSHLGGDSARGKTFTVGIRMKTERVRDTHNQIRTEYQFLFVSGIFVRIRWC